MDSQNNGSKNTNEVLGELFLQQKKSLVLIASLLGNNNTISGNRLVEQEMAIKLNHKIGPTSSGADATRLDGLEVEYKSTNQPAITGRYNFLRGYSLEEQRKIVYEHVMRFKYHYICRYNSEWDVNDIWEMKAEDVWNCLWPKLERQYNRRESGLKVKEPKPRADLSQAEIYKYGTKVYPSDEG